MLSRQKPRPPGSVCDAIALISGLMGTERAAQAVGKSASLLYAWANPDAEQRPSIFQAMDLDGAYVAAGHGEAPILAVYQATLAAVHVPHCPARLADRLVSVVAEMGDVAAAIRAAQDPAGPGGERLTMWEGQRIDREITEAIAELERLRRDVAHAAQVQATKP